MQHSVQVVFSHRFKTRLMQHVGCFEHSKVIIKREPMTILLPEGISPDPALAQRMLAACGPQEPYGIVAIFDATTIYYRDPVVQQISDGSHWGSLDELLQHDQRRLKARLERKHHAEMAQESLP